MILRATIGGQAFEIDARHSGSLGWRWWRRSMLDYGFQDERVLPLGHTADGRLLIAHELDGLLAVVSPHMLFPILDDSADSGASTAAATFINRLLDQPRLL